MAASLQSRSFGVLASGEPVEAWVLSGAGGLEVEAITYGGIVTRLLAPDRAGCLADVVLGFNDLSSYEASNTYFGAITGRVAGRISGGRFTIADQTFQLACNNGPNHLHGGLCGFNQRVWTAIPQTRADGAPSLRLLYCSKNGEEGYPGTVSVSVTYTVTADNSFLIETEASTDHETPFNLTNHSYFNLAGEGAGSIADHELQIDCQEYVATDEHMTLLGQLKMVDAETNDFRQPRLLGPALSALYRSHGDLYRIPTGHQVVRAARVVHRASQRVLEVFTNESYLQLYTGTHLDGTRQGKSGVRYQRFAGLCLECEGYPDGANRPDLGGGTLRPEELQQRSTMYRFSCLPDAGALRYSPAVAKRKDVRIGILGSGFIVDECHLVSYRRGGLNPVAIASRTPEHAARVAARHQIAKSFGSYAELLHDRTIEVLDIAVPPTQQPGLIQAACERGTVKGILAQKPLAVNYTDAVTAVRCCEEAGVVLAVNQNMRFDPCVHTVERMVRDGYFGTPVFATIDMRGIPHWQPWQAETGSASLRIMSIHHLDCMRFWFGEPKQVFCSTRPDPRTQFPHTDGICTTILEYEDGLQCVVIDDVWTGPAREGCPADIRIEWRIEGLDGLAIGDVGWCKDPYTTPSTMRYARKGDASFHRFEPEESWFPDAFAGTMNQLLIALETGAAPRNSGRKNLGTMALVEAAVLSAAEHRVVLRREITEGKAS